MTYLKSAGMASAFLLASFAPRDMDQKNPVTWMFSAERLVNEKNAYVLHMTANIEPEWHIYSQHQDADAIGLPTSFSFTENKALTAPVTLTEVGKQVVHESDIGMAADRYFENSVDFVDTVRVAPGTVISGNVEFMVCRNDQCIPAVKKPFHITTP